MATILISHVCGPLVVPTFDPSPRTLRGAPSSLCSFWNRHEYERLTLVPSVRNGGAGSPTFGPHGPESLSSWGDKKSSSKNERIRTYTAKYSARGTPPRAVPADGAAVPADEGFIRKKLAVFLSGGGSNFRALHASTLSNFIYGDFSVVVSDKPNCKGCEYAREHNIPVVAFPKSLKHAPDGLSDTELVEALRKYEVDFVLLAGYLKLIPEELVKAFPRSILNIHPALLPSFGGKGYFGMKVHEAVVKSGARYSGPTVHFVDEKYDSGPILAQRTVPVLAYDSGKDLAARVLAVEHVLYSEAVAALCEDRISWREDGVPIIRKSWNDSEFY